MNRVPGSVWIAGILALGAWMWWRQKQPLAIAARTGEKISASIFDVLNPSLRAENFNKPTLIAATKTVRADGMATYSCPPGYRYKFTERREHICLRTD